MTPETIPALPVAGSLRVGPAPHWHGLHRTAPMTTALLVAMGIAQFAGFALFGWAALRVLATSVATAMLVRSLLYVVTGRGRSWSEGQAILIGGLFACTLPPGVAWHVPVIGAAVCVIVGELLLGGIGNYLWHPVAVGQVVVQMLMPAATVSDLWPVLGPGRLFWGDVAHAQPLPPLTDWSDAPLADTLEAWLVHPTLQYLGPPVLKLQSGTVAESLAAYVRDVLPGWPDTLLGTAGGAIGAASVLALIIGALVLAWRGVLRGALVGAGLGGAAAAASILPVYVPRSGGGLEAHWLPAVLNWEGWPVGLAYICYQLTAGDLLLVLLLLAPDSSSSPLTRRGQVIFGLMIGGITISLRVLVGLPAAPFWALLICNAMVPVIDRLTRRRVLGT